MVQQERRLSKNEGLRSKPQKTWMRAESLLGFPGLGRDPASKSEKVRAGNLTSALSRGC